MKSATLPGNVHALGRQLPLITLSGTPGPWVSGKELHRLLDVEKNFNSWTNTWAAEWHSWVGNGWWIDIGEPMRHTAGGDIMIYASLASVIAGDAFLANAGITDAGQVSNYLCHAERQWRILNGGLFSASEVADEYHLVDRRTNATRRIGDSLVDFAARRADMPPIGDVGGHSRRKRGFPATLIQAWHREGGGAELIEAERERPKRPARSRRADMFADAAILPETVTVMERA
nr:hypothetical protein [uncultured Roseococcus sp.]